MQTRRELLRSCARGGALLALGGIVVRLASRRFDGNCVRVLPCGGCPHFTGCELPKAQAQRPPAKPNA